MALRDLTVLIDMQLHNSASAGLQPDYGMLISAQQQVTAVSIVRIGIVGTGFAARLRAEALARSESCKLVAIAGRTPTRTQDFARDFDAKACPSVEAMLSDASVNLVFVSTVNCDHAAATEKVLQAGKHAVVEYPLAFDRSQATALIALAKHKERLLHVEHVELLSGIHLTLQSEIPALGQIFYVHYSTMAAARPAPKRWSYSPAQFGFPLVGAVSRIHRLVNLFGTVERVSCQLRYRGDSLPERFSSCLCSAQLSFTSGTVADVTYAKGECLWRSRRTIEVHGSEGSIQLGGEQNAVIRPGGTRTVGVGSRRGLFYKDTNNVIQHLLDGSPLYTTPNDSLHSLEVALAAERAAATNQTVNIAPRPER